MHFLRQGTVPKLFLFLLFAGITGYGLLALGVLWIWGAAMTVLFLILFLLSLIPDADDNGGWGDW